MHEHVQQHACSRSATSSRFLDRPSGHDPAHEDHQLVFWTIQIANVKSAHAITNRALVRDGQVGRSNGSGCPISNLVELEQKGGGGGSGGFGSHDI